MLTKSNQNFEEQKLFLTNKWKLIYNEWVTLKAENNVFTQIYILKKGGKHTNGAYQNCNCNEADNQNMDED